jgi:hypothetical protein
MYGDFGVMRSAEGGRPEQIDLSEFTDRRTSRSSCRGEREDAHSDPPPQRRSRLSAGCCSQRRSEQSLGSRSQRHSRQPASAQNAQRESPSVCGAPFSSTPRSGLAASRPRFPPRTGPTARRAAHGTYYRPCSSITGMSDITEVPAPHAGLLTARSPGRTPSAQYINFLDEGGELISVPNFDFTDDALTPAIEELKNRPFDILAAAIDESRLAASAAREAIDDIFDKDKQRAAARALLAECLERPNNRFVLQPQARSCFYPPFFQKSHLCNPQSFLHGTMVLSSEPAAAIDVESASAGCKMPGCCMPA